MGNKRAKDDRIERAVEAAHEEVRVLEAALEDARQRRSVAVRHAFDAGYGPSGVAALLRITPSAVSEIARRGERRYSSKRRRRPA